MVGELGGVWGEVDVGFSKETLACCDAGCSCRSVAGEMSMRYW